MAYPPAIHQEHGIAANSEAIRAGVNGSQRPYGATIDFVTSHSSCGPTGGSPPVGPSSGSRPNDRPQPLHVQPYAPPHFYQYPDTS
ncbi:hypothetical protein GCM10010428_48880 [Actinosynnema pretiosum subsp. pretiosum]